MRSARLMSSALVVVAIAAIGVVWTANTRLRPVEAQGVDPRIPQGFAIAPVYLNLAGRDYNKVGLGSYLVNAVGDCNGCHSSNSTPLALYPYISGKNPYFHQPEKIDPSV